MRSHSSAMSAGASVWSHASRPNAYQFACANGWPHQLRASPVLATAAMPPVSSRGRPGQAAVDDRADRRAAPARVGVGGEHLAPHRRQVREVRREAQVLLRDLQLQHQRRRGHRAEQRVERLARLEVDGAVLDLQRTLAGTCRPAAPARCTPACAILGDVGLVDERAPDDDAAVRGQRVRQHVGAVGVRAAVVLRSGLPLRVGLDQEAAEVGDERVDLVRLGAPPGRDAFVQRIGVGQAGELDWRGRYGLSGLLPQQTLMAALAPRWRLDESQKVLVSTQLSYVRTPTRWESNVVVVRMGQNKKS